MKEDMESLLEKVKNEHDELQKKFDTLLAAAENVDQFDFSEDEGRAREANAPTDAYIALGELTTVLRVVRP